MEPAPVFGLLIVCCGDGCLRLFSLIHIKYNNLKLVVAYAGARTTTTMTTSRTAVAAAAAVGAGTPAQRSN